MLGSMLVSTLVMHAAQQLRRPRFSRSIARDSLAQQPTAHLQPFLNRAGAVTELEVQLPTDYRCTCQCGVKLIVRVPGGPGCPYPAPYPLVLFASGFQVRLRVFVGCCCSRAICRRGLSSNTVTLLMRCARRPACCCCHSSQATSLNYRQYATRLASWGFAVLQYDFVKWSPTIDALCHSDAAEVRLVHAELAGSGAQRSACDWHAGVCTSSRCGRQTHAAAARVLLRAAHRLASCCTSCWSCGSRWLIPAAGCTSSSTSRCWRQQDTVEVAR